ncbi:hypothetical protein CN166_06710 [Sinorhizobium medicae]|uniref:hypothetical protein n=1 Tax=Sinorhizobium medicae TaxID=110321 RepID=UPI000FD60D9D|nr:hypothetical protein [Sinorhizobium medicae]MQV96740.1 hypothetical protein [Sinorhizobium medicae]RVJ61733.1 hypothetical protein CN166_06710 [Sinorhizobium medicae]RVJ73545.1 hypothetical protein CN167_18860 [Sinorhizobium medicae]
MANLAFDAGNKKLIRVVSEACAFDSVEAKKVLSSAPIVRRGGQVPSCKQEIMVDCTPHIRSAAVTYRSIRQSAFPLRAFRRTQILGHRQVLQARE